MLMTPGHLDTDTCSRRSISSSIAEYANFGLGLVQSQAAC